MTARERMLAECEAIEAEIAVALRTSDEAAGLVPAKVSRPLFPHELAAGVNFAAIDTDVTAAGSALSRLLAEQRDTFADLLHDDLMHAQLAGADLAVAERVLELASAGLGDIPGVPGLVAGGTQQLAAALRQVAELGALGVHSELASQGIPIPPTPAAPAGDVAAQLHLLANRLAVAPHTDVLGALATSAPAVAPVDPLLARLDAIMRNLARTTLDSYGQRAATQAHGLGRQTGALQVGGWQRIYASEILDSNTCEECLGADGREYTSLDDAQLDYPQGTYIDCEGGDRCRGTLVFVGPTETPPTVGEIGPAVEQPAA